MMGINVEARIVWGARILDEYEVGVDERGHFPLMAAWKEVNDKDEFVYEDDIVEWWRVINGYKYIEDTGFTWAEQFRYQDEFDEDHPLIYAVVDDGAYDGRQSEYFILKRSLIVADWSEALVFNPLTLIVNEEEERKYNEFVEKYGIRLAGPPAWLLIARLS